jgi:hypothetical protein
VAVNMLITSAAARERSRSYLPWLCRTFTATANAREYMRMPAEPPCKRAVVSSILTGGSAYPGVNLQVKAYFSGEHACDRAPLGHKLGTSWGENGESPACARV